jgi:hypothetical protein
VLVAGVSLANPFVGALCVTLRAAGHAVLGQRLYRSWQDGDDVFDLNLDEREAVLDALSPYAPDALRELRDALEDPPTTADRAQ